MMIKNNKGFTLIELMIVLAIAIVVMAGTYYAFDFQHRSYLTEEEITGMQQNQRAAMLMLERDIRWAGFDPTMNAGAGFTAAGPTGFTYTFLADHDTLDNDGDGTPDNTGELETVAYSFYDFPTASPDGDMDIGRQLPTRLPPGNGVQPVAENIEAVEYWYTLADGTQTTAPTNVQLSEIRAIQVWILARTSRDINRLPDGQVYTTPSGVALNGGAPFPDADGDGLHFRRRILTASIKCRNMP